MSAVLTGTKVNRYNKYQTNQLHAHTHTCTRNSWWLVLRWVTTNECHQRLRIAYMSNIWRVIEVIITIAFTEYIHAQTNTDTDRHTVTHTHTQTHTLIHPTLIIAFFIIFSYFIHSQIHEQYAVKCAINNNR